MRKWIMGTALAAAMTGPVLAQGEAITGVIGSQIEAFKSDDFASAFEFAAPSIQNIFRTPENFGVMVQRGYPMVWRPAEVTFLELRQEQGAYWQRVQIVDGDGGVHYLDYRMTETSDGWKISGVQLVDASSLSA